jgi:predicted enzyme related to lactoylglutathione lyase
MMMLADNDVIAFVPTTDPARAKAFYRDVLGLRLQSEDGFAVVFDGNGTTIRVVNVTGVKGFKPFPFTVLGWTVDDIAKNVRELVFKGVEFQHYDGMGQDAQGVWQSPSGARVAWFSDPEGNILSLTQH